MNQWCGAGVENFWFKVVASQCKSTVFNSEYSRVYTYYAKYYGGGGGGRGGMMADVEKWRFRRQNEKRGKGKEGKLHKKRERP